MGFKSECRLGSREEVDNELTDGEEEARNARNKEVLPNPTFHSQLLLI